QKDAALEEASGVKGAKFCHNGRFIAVADSREAILQMADIAVKEALAA
ncbi:MAG TPA: MYG1 family protein, partial [Sulfitobacter pontiacus]|nr:MYG1 family protein [Sulfitobacter pontiacus]